MPTIDEQQNAQIESLDTRVDSLESKEIEQEDRLDGQDLKNRDQDNQLTNIDSRLDALEDSKTSLKETHDEFGDGHIDYKIKDDGNDICEITKGKSYKIYENDTHKLITGDTHKEVEGSTFSKITGDEIEKILNVDEINKTVKSKDGNGHAQIVKDIKANVTSSHDGDITKTHTGTSTATHHGRKNQYFMGGVFKNFLGALQSFNLSTTNKYYLGIYAKVKISIELAAYLGGRIRLLISDDAVYVRKNNYVGIKAETVGAEYQFKAGVFVVHGAEKGAKASKSDLVALRNKVDAMSTEMEAVSSETIGMMNEVAALDSKTKAIEQNTHALNQRVAGLRMSVSQEIFV